MRFLLAVCILAVTSPLFAAVWNVGPTRTYTTPSAVSNLVNHGDTVLIDAAVYLNHPQVYFTKNNLLLRGIGGRPRLEAGAALAGNNNGKAIFVISGSDCRVEHLEFANAAVPDHNGAGIRQEGCGLVVTDCFFYGNEMGILGGNYTDCTVRLEHNVFANNGSSANPGYQHNVYIGKIDTLIFRYNYSVDAIAEGHELKSRARNNIILYNYIGNLNTVDSRTIDLPNGGTAILVGNIIEQGPNSANSNLFGYGLEGLNNPAPHQVWLVNNTFVNKKATGSFIHVANGTDGVFMKNNILVGAATGGLLNGQVTQLDSSHNFINSAVTAAGFVAPAAFDYRLTSGSPAVNQGIDLAQNVGEYVLKAQFQYADTANYSVRPTAGLPDLGAYEFLPASSVSTEVLRWPEVFPNPARTAFFGPNIPEDAPFSLLNTLGQSVKKGLVTGGQLDVSGVPAGTYMLFIAGYLGKIVVVY